MFSLKDISSSFSPWTAATNRGSKSKAADEIPMPAMNGVELPSAPPTPAGKLRSAEMQAALSCLSAHLTDGPSRQGPAQWQGRIDAGGSGIDGPGSMSDFTGPSEQVGGEVGSAPTERPLPVYNPTPTLPSDFAPNELTWPSAVVSAQ